MRTKTRSEETQKVNHSIGFRLDLGEYNSGSCMNKFNMLLYNLIDLYQEINCNNNNNSNSDKKQTQKRIQNCEEEKQCNCSHIVGVSKL